MCLICDRIEMIKRGENKFFVKQLQTGYVVIGDVQHFRGYTLFLFKRHETELFRLEENERALFMHEMTVVAEAVNNAFGAQKMNYELLGMGDSHLHWHLFPRKYGDLGEYGVNGNGPVWWYPKEKFYAESACPTSEELSRLRAALLAQFD